MSNVVPSPEDSAERLQKQIGADLTAQGSARAEIDQLEVSAVVWRALARKVGRSLGRPVQTLEAHGHVHAVLKDWPATAAEEEITQTALRRAMDSFDLPSRP